MPEQGCKPKDNDGRPQANAGTRLALVTELAPLGSFATWEAERQSTITTAARSGCGPI